MQSPKDTGGPIVKTGPTKGKTRSRNKNGRWRKKRSDAGLSREVSRFLRQLDAIDKGKPYIKYATSEDIGIF